MATILKGTHQLVVDDVVYDLEEMVEEYKAKTNGNSRITDAKFRINTQTDNPQEMLDDIAAWLGFMKVVKLEFSNWYAGEVEKSEKEKFVVGNFNGSPIELEYHMDFSTHWHVNSEVADYFVGKTFGEMMAVIKTLRVPFNLFDQTRHLELEDDKGLRIVFSCRADCQLTLQYASDDSVYEEFIMICRQHYVPFKIGICGIIEEDEVETEYVRTPTGKKRKTDWTCLL